MRTRAGSGVLDGEAELLGGLAPGGLAGGLAGVDVPAGLHPDPQALVPVQHRAAPPDDDARGRDVRRARVLVAGVGQTAQLGQEALARRDLTRRCGLVALDQGPQVLRGGARRGTPHHANP